VIITPKRPRNDTSTSRISRLVPYMLKGKGAERCTWYRAGNLEGLDRQEDAKLALSVMELIQEGNVRSKKDKAYHVVISFHPNDRKLLDTELENVVRRTVAAAGLEEHQYIAVRHSDQEHEHVHVAVNKIHPETLKIHHPFRDVPRFKALATELEEELGLHKVDRSVRRMESDRSRDCEAQRGIQSFSRWARRLIGDRTKLEGIPNWEALHHELQGFRVRLVPRGNGFAIVDATRPNLACKASALGREWSRQRLCDRFGNFVPGPDPAQVARKQANAYLELPLGRVDDDGLWREYQDALAAARVRRGERREALSSKIDASRTALRRRFKLRHHAIGAMPISGMDKRKLYKMLAFERKAAERKFEMKINGWRTAGAEMHPGSWKEFLAARASRGDQRAIRRLTRRLRGPAIKGGDNRLRALPSRGSRTSRGSVIHSMPGGVRLRESAGSIELLGDDCDGALEQLVSTAEQRFGSQRVTLLGSVDVRKRLAQIAIERGLEIAQERER
jgi:hypothetical protein